MEKVKIILNNEKYLLEKIYVSELGFIMVKLFKPATQTYHRYNCGLNNPEHNFIHDLINKNERRNND